jgi:hypothetical protein
MFNFRKPLPKTPLMLESSVLNIGMSAQYYRPAFSDEALQRCKNGHHEDSKTMIVAGYSGHDPVEHYFCACGDVRWLYFDHHEMERSDGWASSGGWEGELTHAKEMDEMRERVDHMFDQKPK